MHDRRKIDQNNIIVHTKRLMIQQQIGICEDNEYEENLFIYCYEP